MAKENAGRKKFTWLSDILIRFRLTAVVMAIGFLLTGFATLLQATTISGNLTVDNSFSLYISEDDSQLGTLVASGDNWMVAYSFTHTLTPGRTQYIHVKASDVGVVSGFLGSFRLSDNSFAFNNGGQSLLTNTSGWTVYTDRFGGTRGTITLADGFFGSAKNGGGWTRHATIDTNAYWIWTNRGLDINCTRYFSAPINPATILIAANPLSLVEGQNGSLDVSALIASGNLTAGHWVQVSGPPIALSSSTSATPSFVAPPVEADGAVAILEYRAANASGTPVVISSTISIADNGITGFPSDAVTFKTITGKDMGMRIGNGSLTRVATIDPETVATKANKPSSMIYGLMDMEIRTANPGDTVTVSVLLPGPAPDGYGWFKYGALGWYNFSDHAVFSADRTLVTLTLIDGGAGDEDGVADGVIHDPSGLGTVSLSLGGGGTGGGGGGTGCFIATAAYGSPLHPYVTVLREFRDKVLLASRPGMAFVEWYYRVSPPIAETLSRNAPLKTGVQILLLPLIGFSWLVLKAGSCWTMALLVFFGLLVWLAATSFRRVSYDR